MPDCTYCNVTFAERSEWKYHLCVKHNVIGYCCDLCDHVYYTEQEYLDHINTHTSHRHPCSYCGASYKMYKYLERHIADQHEMGKRIKCPTCGEEFYNDTMYAKHMHKHKIGKKFSKCKICNRSFTSSRLLLLHKQLDHQANRNAKFRRYVDENLNVDPKLLRNLGKCVICQVKFSCRIDLLRHFKMVHSKKLYYLCCQCDNVVSRHKTGLGVHMLFEHGIPRNHSCAKCRKGHKTNPIKSSPVSVEKAPQPWIKEYKSQLPSDLNLVNTTELELNNLRNNIKVLFKVLCTVPTSKLKGNTTVETYNTEKNLHTAEDQDLTETDRLTRNSESNLSIQTSHSCGPGDCTFPGFDTSTNENKIQEIYKSLKQANSSIQKRRCLRIKK